VTLRRSGTWTGINGPGFSTKLAYGKRSAGCVESGCFQVSYRHMSVFRQDELPMSESRVKGISTLPEAPDSYLCEECDQVTAIYLSAPNPFDRTDTITGCPNCQSVDSLVRACWKCNRRGTIGTTASTEFRYIHTCFEHNPERVLEEQTHE